MGVGLKFVLLEFRNPRFKGNFFFEFGSLEFERGESLTGGSLLLKVVC